MKSATKHVNTWCVILILSVTGCSSVKQPVRIPPAVYLSGVMDQFNKKFWVYSDGDAAGNHFTTLVRMSNGDNNHQTNLAEQMLPPMNLFCTNQPHAGPDCIEASFHPATSEDRGAWYFMNGVLSTADCRPETNRDAYSNAGLNLSHATQLSFWAKGKEGGERVEFFAFGVGRHPDSGIPDQPCHDSSPKRSLGFINLSREWTDIKSR